MSDNQDIFGDSDSKRIFEQELLPHLDAMYNFAFHITYNEDDAKDLVQETYFKAFRFVRSFQSGTNAKAWLFKILKNHFINDFRKKSKEPYKVDYQEVESMYNAEDAPAELSMSIKADEPFDDSMGDEVSVALNALALDFKIVIILCDVEGFTYDEMSKILDIPIGTVRSRLHRARNLLREKLSAYAKSMGYRRS
ncbi:MAG: sigma-70 family RNA polymerase sigma factor [Cyclobacteriaceae bacterium]